MPSNFAGFSLPSGLDFGVELFIRLFDESFNRLFVNSGICEIFENQFNQLKTLRTLRKTLRTLRLIKRSFPRFTALKNNDVLLSLFGYFPIFFRNPKR